MPWGGSSAHVPRREMSVRQQSRIGPWDLFLRSEQGLVRERIEDAWVLLPDAPLGGIPGGAWGVFDGLGGVPHGAEAAWAAANNLHDVFRQSKTAEELLRRLNPYVVASRGATTAVILWTPLTSASSKVRLISVGDSGVYELRPNVDPILLNEKDSQGPTVVTDYLGNAGVAGHVTEWGPSKDATLLACSDGVDGVVPLESLSRFAGAADMMTALDELFAEIQALGAPDNATAIVARRA